MITVTTTVHVDELTGKEVTDFFLHAGDFDYQRWWPGTHLRYRVRRVEGDVGSVVSFDEYVGRRRLRLKGVVLESVPGKRLVLRLAKGVPLPALLVLDLRDEAGGVEITHTVRAGYGGVGSLLDPLFGLYLSPGFCAALDAHAKTEFERLGRMFHPAAA